MTGRARAAAIALTTLLGGCGVHATVDKMPVPPPLVQQSVERYRKEYVLLHDDQIEVVVQRVPEASRVVVIRPDGYISLPLLGDVKAAGLTPMELAAKLTELFSKRLLEPEVTVIATRVRAATVYVTGDVNSPMALPLRDAPTALQAIAMTGGFRRSGASGDVVIIRLNPEGYVQALRFPATVGGQPGPYMALRMVQLEPDDLIFVPENGRSQFNRFVDDIINKPLSGLQSLFLPVINYRLFQVLSQQAK